MIDMRAERCKTCIHTPVCGRDMNTVGPMYVSPNPMFFTKEYCDEALRKYQEREAAGFPCEFYKCMCKDCKFWGENMTEEERNECDVYSDLVCTYWLSDGLTRDDFCSNGKRRENE